MGQEEKLCLLVIAIILISIVSYFGYNWLKDRADEKEAEEERARLFIENGDQITFEVTGFLDNGRIFYTTEQSINDDELQLKSANYKFFTDEPDFSTVGAELESKFNSGFVDAVLNMRIDENKRFTVTPENGYGWPNESLVKTIPRFDSINLYNDQSTVDFQNSYNPEDIPLFIGQRFTHVYWNWQIELVEVNNISIKYKHLPEIDQEITALPWPAEVTDISEKDGKIYFKHNIGSEHIFTTVDPIELVDFDKSYLDLQDIQTELGIGLVPGVIIDQDQNTFTIDFNEERAGKNIRYEITILDIEKP